MGNDKTRNGEIAVCVRRIIAQAYKPKPMLFVVVDATLNTGDQSILSRRQRHPGGAADALATPKPK